MQLSILSPNLPWIIPPMSSFLIVVRFNPQGSGQVYAYLKLLGTPCDFVDSILFTSNPIASRATISIDNHKGLIGEVITIPILIKDATMLDQSGTTRIRTKINYDQSLLKFISTNPAVDATQSPNSLFLNNIPFSPNVTNLLDIQFEVLNSATSQTVLDINSTETIDGWITFTEEDGFFEVLPSSAEISVGEVEVNTGEEFLLPIYLKNVKNLTSFHTAISTEISFNYSLMEPIGSTPKGTINIQSNTNTIKIDNLPLTPVNSDSAIALLQFRAKLGNSPETKIDLTNTKTTKGLVIFAEKPGKLTIKNICNSGGLRLFEPNPNTPFLLHADPGTQSIYVKFTPRELSQHKLIITDLLGNVIEKLEFSF
ncbi:MAG: hypothetical protein ACK4SO_07920, partial [Candidatus Kapaibacteriota bacterium]